MNPIINKKDFDDLSTNLKDLAYAYLEKYSPSKQQLKTYLLKKYLLKFKSSRSKKDITNLIDEILKNLEKNKLINDEFKKIFNQSVNDYIRIFFDCRGKSFKRSKYRIQCLHRNV